MLLQTRSILIALGASALFGASATAQYVGTTTVPTYRSVADVLKNPVDDAPVTLEGTISKQLGKKKYMFTDGTAEIRIEVDRKHLPATPFDEKTRVRIQGDIEKDFMQSPEIDVKDLAIVK